MTTNRIRIGITAFIAALLVLTAGVFCYAEDDAVLCYSEEEAAQVLREAMKERADSAGICLITDVAAADSEGMIGEIFDAAIEHTGDPKEGDYLRFQYQNCHASAKAVTESGRNAILFTYSLSYYDTAEQEEALDEAVDGIIEFLELDDMSDAEKTETIYNYLRDNVEYDYDNLTDSEYLLKHTAYAALVDGKAVCQGYSAALYRLLLEAGVDNRIIFGTGIDSSGNSEEHTWNIVKVGDAYYNCDVTRDDELGGDQYFLKAADPFSEDHIRDEEYLTEDFKESYAVSDTDYSRGGSAFLEHVSKVSLEFRTMFRRLVRAI